MNFTGWEHPKILTYILGVEMGKLSLIAFKSQSSFDF